MKTNSKKYRDRYLKVFADYEKKKSVLSHYEARMEKETGSDDFYSTTEYNEIHNSYLDALTRMMDAEKDMLDAYEKVVLSHAKTEKDKKDIKYVFARLPVSNKVRKEVVSLALRME
jgi:hypothetical protein